MSFGRGLFNQLSLEVIPLVLELSSNYSFYERLVQTNLSGLIGMDIKEHYNKTTPMSHENIVPLDINVTNFEKSLMIYNTLNDKVHTYKSKKMEIDSFEDYYNEVILSKEEKLVTWFTDDFIPTIFELKFIEEQIQFNKKLNFCLVPRYDSYSNDASYQDMLSIIELPLFNKLKSFYIAKRFQICSKGMDIATLNGNRISKEVARLLQKSDITIISGARSYEMAQGINKTTYFTGISVCKKTVTGINK